MSRVEGLTASDAERPWPGLSPFTEWHAARFHGRGREISELLRLVDRDTLTLLYGKSGVGKSSLLDAGFFPRLRGRADVPVRIRLRADEGAEPLTIQCWRAVMAAFERLQVLGEPPTTADVLWDLLHSTDTDLRTPDGRVARFVLVFDQFEEVLRASGRRGASGGDPLELEHFFDLLEALVVHSPPRRRETVEERSENLGAARYRLVLALREDELPAFNTFRERCQIGLENHLRLEDLNSTQALESVLGTGGPLVDRATAQAIVDYVSGTGSKSNANLSLGVPPAILSLVCFELNDRRLARRPPSSKLNLADLTPANDRARSLSTGMNTSEPAGVLDDYCQRAMRSAGSSLAHYIEDRLVTPDGSRDLKPLAELVKAAGDAARVERLIDEWRVLREVPRNNARWVELSHDVLVPGIAARRTKREQSRLLRLRNLWRMVAGALFLMMMIAIAAVVASRRLTNLANNQRQIAQLLGAAGARDATVTALVILATPMAPETNDALPQLLAALEAPIASYVFPSGPHAAFSADGQRIVLANADGTAWVQRADGKGQRIVLSAHWRALNSAAFSPDGQYVVTASDDSTARVWRADGTGSSLVLSAHQGAVTGAVFSPDGRQIVTASVDGTARMWRADGTTEPVVLRGHTGGVTSVSFSENGRLIVTASADGTARVWNSQGTPLGVVNGVRKSADSLLSAAFSPDGRQVVIGSKDGSASVWRADGLGEPVILKGVHTGAVTTARFSPDGQQIVTSSRDGTARVWRADGTGVPNGLLGHAGVVGSAVFSPDGRQILTASFDGTARIWQPSQLPVMLNQNAEPIRSAVFSPDGQRIASVLNDSVRIWRADGTGTPVILRGHSGPVSSATFSPDGREIVTASVDGTARVWNSDGSIVAVLRGHQGPVMSAAFSADGRVIVTASTDRTARVWSSGANGIARVWRRGRTLQLPAGLYSAALSPNGEDIVTASVDGMARVWRPSLKWVNLKGHLGSVLTAEYSGDGQAIVTGSSDGTARVWRSLVDGSGTFLLLKGHGGPVRSASFSPDGRRIVTASFDRTARIWRADADHGGTSVVLTGHSGEVLSAVFSPDGQHVLTASMDGMVLRWPATVSALRTRLSALTQACLDTLSGVRYLSETRAIARARFDRCERSHGRLGLAR